MIEKKTIPGYSAYAATSDGHIVNVKTGKSVAEHVANGGYLACQLTGDDGRKSHILIHRAVAMAFHANAEGKGQVDHIDSNRKNNAASNLRWVTAKENAENVTSLPRGRKWSNCATVLNIKLDRETRALLNAQADENGRAACREAEAIIKKAVK